MLQRRSEGVPGAPRAEIGEVIRKDAGAVGIEPFDEDASIGGGRTAAPGITRHATRKEGNMEGLRAGSAGAQEDGPYLGEAMEFFLWSKGAGGRSEKTLADYRTKLEAFQRWAAGNKGTSPCPT